ncbi:hypothetical protein D3C86_1934510 [compost metagenome]
MLERFVSTNHLNIKAYQSALGNAYRDDKVVNMGENVREDKKIVRDDNVNIT